MDWISKMERKFGRFAISNLMFYIIILYGIGFVIEIINPQFYYSYLSLDASAILSGQIWRVVTFLIQPPSGSVIFIVFALYLYFMIGQSLERAWGAFRFNLYFFSGVLLHVIAAIVVYFLFGVSLPMGTAYLNLSLYFAFAALYPDTELLLFFVVPVKIKYLAWINGAYFLYTIAQAFMPVYANSEFSILFKANALAAFVSVLNFLIFFFSSKQFKQHSSTQLRRKKFEQDMRQSRTNYEERNRASLDRAGAHHRCAVCGRTELDDPTLEFRYCSKCNGNFEYCQDHLYTHEHKN